MNDNNSLVHTSWNCKYYNVCRNPTKMSVSCFIGFLIKKRMVKYSFMEHKKIKALYT